MKVLTAILFVTSATLPSAHLTSDHLTVFEGEWTGTLTYLNYGDDETLVDLPVRMVATSSDDGLSFAYFYNEGDGRTEERKGAMRLKGKRIYYNGNWEVDTTTINDLESWEILLVSKGKDNGKKAAFKMILKVSAEEIEATKWVRYDGESTDYFMRNRHIFRR